MLRTVTVQIPQDRERRAVARFTRTQPEGNFRHRSHQTDIRYVNGGARLDRIRIARLTVALVLAAGPAATWARTPANSNTGNGGVSIGPSQQLSQPSPAPASSQVEHLLGDVGGYGAKLARVGVTLILDATTEFAGNVSGGIKQGATFANQVGFEADVDWGVAAGLTGLSTHTVIVSRSGNNTSHLFGDNLEPV